jgi:hypothetical protein
VCSAAVGDVVRMLVHEVPFPVPGLLAVRVDVGVGTPLLLALPPSSSFPRLPYRVHLLFQAFKVWYSGICCVVLCAMLRCQAVYSCRCMMLSLSLSLSLYGVVASCLAASCRVLLVCHGKCLICALRCRLFTCDRVLLGRAGVGDHIVARCAAV